MDIYTFAVVHDSKQCFLELNSGISANSPDFERFTVICKETGSENIAKILETIEKEKNFDMESLSSIDVYQEKKPVFIFKSRERLNWIK